MPKRQIMGTVIKIAGEKTATIVVERKVIHPRYHKTVKRFKKYLIHDENATAKVGDTVFLLSSVDQCLREKLLNYLKL